MMQKLNSSNDLKEQDLRIFDESEINKSAVYVPRWPLLIHIAAAIIQMGASAYYHLYGTISCHEMKFLRKYDYGGICIMICGSTTAPFYYGFMCDDSFFWGKVYMAQVYACCLFALYVTLWKSAETANLWVNAISYIIAGYSTVPGIYHLTYWSPPEQVHNMAMWPWLGGGILYAIGAIIYAAKIPESLL